MAPPVFLTTSSRNLTDQDLPKILEKSNERFETSTASPDISCCSSSCEDEKASSLVDQEEDQPASLFERLGGMEALEAFTHAFVRAIGNESKLSHFFENVPIETLRVHQRQLFRVVFGGTVPNAPPPPTTEELIDFLILTHSRLFRDLGLDATHFDIVAGCFVQAAEQVQIPSHLLQECLAIVAPLRAAFVKGAARAKKQEHLRQKKLKEEEKESEAAGESGKDSLLSKQMVPESTPVPIWLLELLHRCSKSHNTPRAPPDESSSPLSISLVLGPWTCALTSRLTVQDPVLPPVFLAIPYMDLVPYVHALMQMAFCNPNSLPQNAGKLIRILRFPQGIAKAREQMTQTVFGRVMDQFLDAAHELLSIPHEAASNSEQDCSSSNKAVSLHACSEQELLLTRARINLTNICPSFVLDSVAGSTEPRGLLIPYTSSNSAAYATTTVPNNKPPPCLEVSVRCKPSFSSRKNAKPTFPTISSSRNTMNQPQERTSRSVGGGRKLWRPRGLESKKAQNRSSAQ